MMGVDAFLRPLSPFTAYAQGEDRKRWRVAEVLLRERTQVGKMPLLDDVVAATKEASEMTDDEVDVRLMMEELAK